jgi:hypothetical protein
LEGSAKRIGNSTRTSKNQKVGRNVGHLPSEHSPLDWALRWVDGASHLCSETDTMKKQLSLDIK